MLPHELPHAALRGQDTDEGERARVEHFDVIDEHGKLAVMTFDGTNVEAERASQVCRHPGGLDSRDSVAAAAHGHDHLFPLR